MTPQKLYRLVFLNQERRIKEGVFIKLLVEVGFDSHIQTKISNKDTCQNSVQFFQQFSHVDSVL